MDQKKQNTKPQRSRKKLFLKLSIISVGLFVLPIFFNQSVAQSAEETNAEIIETAEIVEIVESVAGTSPEEETTPSDSETTTETITEITTIESDDFASSLQDILDAPAGTEVSFTLTEVTTEDEFPRVTLGEDEFVEVEAEEELSTGTGSTSTDTSAIFTDTAAQIIESDDFASSVQDILDAPAGTEVSFTLTEVTTEDETDETIEEVEDITDTIETITDISTTTAIDESPRVTLGEDELSRVVLDEEGLDKNDDEDFEEGLLELDEEKVDEELQPKLQKSQIKTHGTKTLVFSEERYWQVASDAITVPVVESTTPSNLDAGTAFIMDMPATRPDGDLYIAIAGKDDDLDFAVVPSNWNLVYSLTGGNQVRHSVWWWIGSSEPASYTLGNDNEDYSGAIIRISGADTSNPIHATSTDSLDESSTPTAPAITPTIDKTLILHTATIDTDQWNATYYTSAGTALFGQNSGAAESGSANTAGASKTGTLSSSGTGVFSANGSDEWAAGTISIAPFNPPPTVVLNSPDDLAEILDTTPTLEFTGTDDEGEEIEYEVQVSNSGGFGIDDSHSIDNFVSCSTLDTNDFGYGQAFTSKGGLLTSVKFYLRKDNSPTGNAVVKIYNETHSTAFGTDSLPTGAALATSDVFDVSTLTTSYQLITFTFTGAEQITLTEENYYVVTIEYSNGGAIDFVYVGIDIFSPTHSGNQVDYGISSWVAYNSLDLIFYVYATPTTFLNKFSETDAGFTAGHPFASGSSTDYTVQDIDTLDPGTYYWRVRAIDPLGGNTYGSWATTSSFTIMPSVTVSGTVYTDEGSATSSAGSIVNLIINGVSIATTTVSTDTATYSFSLSSSLFSTSTPVAVFLDDNANEKGNTITRYSGSGNITDFDIYQNRIIVRHEDEGPLTIDDLDKYDFNDDSDILFTASAAADTLTASSTSELFVWSGDTFSTGGAGGAIYLNDVDINGTTTATSTQTISVSGSWDATGGTFNSASSTVEFTSVTGGKSLTVNDNPFWNLTFNGSGGGWNIADNATTTNDLTVTLGTATGTADFAVLGGDATGNGTLNFTGGTFTLDGTGNFGGTSDWTFYNLNFGDGTGASTTTALNSATSTISNILTIDTSQILNAGSSKVWILSGSGTPFVINGTFNYQTSIFKYTANADTYITDTDYYHLELKPDG